MTEVFQTSDPDLAEHILRDSYGGSIRLDAGGQPVSVRLASTSLGPSVRLDRINLAMNLGLAADTTGALVIGQIRSGRISFQSDGSERVHGPGDVYFAVQPGHSCTTRSEELDFETAVIDPALLSQVADTAPGRAQQPVRLAGYAPVSPQAAQTWKDTSAYVRDAVLASPGAAAQPLLVSITAQLLAAVALATFPSNALTDPTIEDRHDAHPDTLRRAVTFIDEHAHQEITVADIAAASYVTARAVQLAFRRHLDTTPMEYLRRVRLAAAHGDLLTASPVSTTITAVAYRWGFASSSRFAEHYRHAYGVRPSHTLHRD